MLLSLTFIEPNSGGKTVWNRQIELNDRLQPISNLFVMALTIYQLYTIYKL